MSDGVWVALLLAAPLAVTGALAWRTRRFLARALRTQGTIVEMQELPPSPDRRHRFYAPVVEFSSKGGSKVQFRSRSVPATTPYRRGQAVDVLYEAADPAATAQIAGDSVWRPVAWSGCATLLMLGWIILGLLERSCP